MRKIVTTACACLWAMLSFANHWTPNADFEFNTTLTGIVVVNGVEQRSESLELGVFCDGECRGSQMPMYVALIDRYVYFTQIYGMPADVFSFKLYDHELGEELELSSPQAITFDEEGFGSLSNPYMLNFTEIVLDSYQVSLSANPSEGGVVEGSGEYATGSTATVTAVAHEGYAFLNWTESGEVVSTTPSYSFVVTSDRVLEAHFAVSESHWLVHKDFEFDMTLTGVVRINGVEQRSEALELGVFCDGECRGSQKPMYIELLDRYVYFTQVYGFATDEFTFRLYDHNQGKELDLESPEDIAYDVEGYGVLANPYVLDFIGVVYQVNVSANPPEGGVVTGGGVYDSGSTVTLTATPNEGYEFINWTSDGVEVNTELSFTVTATADIEYVANFGRIIHTITVIADPAEGGTVAGAGAYDHGTTATLTATPNEGYSFVGWTTDGVEVSTEATYSFAVTSDRVLTANFALSQDETVVIELTQGWNWISYLPKTEMTVEAAFANLDANDGDMVKSQDAFSTYNASTGQWSGGLNTFTPGRGLLFLRNGDATSFSYPKIRDENRGDNNRTTQELTVYQGTKLDERVPVTGWHADKYGKCEFVYPQGSVSLMANSEITALKVYSSSSSKTFGNARYRVFMKTISSSTIDSYYEENGATIVYEGSLSVSNGEMLIRFTTPFVYHGGHLLVGVYQVVKGSGLNTCYFYGQSVNDASIVGWNTSNINNITASTSQYPNFLPKTTFTYSPVESSFTITASANPLDGGSVAGMGEFVFGSVCTMLATASSGYRFVDWTEDGVVISTTASYTFTVENQRNLVANFELDADVAIALNPGWNWISYLPKTEMTVEAAFANLNANDGDMVKSQDAFSTYNASTGQWTGGLSTFTPGRGLIYLRNGEATTFTYPE